MPSVVRLSLNSKHEIPYVPKAWLCAFHPGFAANVLEPGCRDSWRGAWTNLEIDLGEVV